MQGHLRCGDFLHGEKLEQVKRKLSAFGVTDIDKNETAAGLLDFWRALRWLIPGWPAMNRKSKATDDPDKNTLAELLSGRHKLIDALSAGRLEGKSKNVPALNNLLARAKTLARRENFFHWQTFFPDVFSGHSVKNGGDFDLIIGNPPWDRIKLQKVEWFAEHSPEIAKEPRAADRKTRIAALQEKRDPLWKEYQAAMESAEANARAPAKSGDFPLLGGGDVNLYSLFVERAQNLIQPDGLVALLTPSGIAADKGAAAFFRGISDSWRLSTLYDFENRQNPGGSYFPDVDSRFKFCALVFGGEKRTFDTARCAFYLHDINELDTEERVLELSSEDFNRVNPNTGAAPIFRNRRDADITLRIYREHPVLVDRSGSEEKRVWPVKYLRMFDMTNDSVLFKTRAELEQEGFERTAFNRWQKTKKSPCRSTKAKWYRCTTTGRRMWS